MILKKRIFWIEVLLICSILTAYQFYEPARAEDVSHLKEGADEISIGSAKDCIVSADSTSVTNSENTSSTIDQTSGSLNAEAMESNQRIKFAGVWLRGNAQDAKQMFPVGSQFAVFPGADESAAEYSRELLKGIRKEQKPNGKRIMDMIAPDDFLPKAASGRALVMACAINYEYFEKTIEVGVPKLYVEVGFDLLICNFSDRSVVMSIPGICQYVDKATNNPEQRAAQILEKEIYKKSLVKEFYKQAGRAWNGELSFTSVGLGSLEIREEARQRFPELFGKNPELYYSQLISNRFSKEIGLPIIPFSNGEEAVYYGLRENLADASTLEAKRISEQSAEGASFLLKKPEYTIDLIIPGFIEKNVQQTELGYTSAHYALARLMIKKGADSEPFFNEVIQGGATRINANGHKLQPIWITSWDASALMFKDAAKAIKSSGNEMVREMIRTSVIE